MGSKIDIRIEIVDGPSAGNIYRRNNKTRKVRNMLCFPRCCEDGHRDRSWCGNIIKAVLKVDKRYAHKALQ